MIFSWQPILEKGKVCILKQLWLLLLTLWRKTVVSVQIFSFREERREIVAKYDRGREDGAVIDDWEDPKFDVYHKKDRYGFIHDHRLPEIVSRYWTFLSIEDLYQHYSTFQIGSGAEGSWQGDGKSWQVAGDDNRQGQMVSRQVF